MHQKIKVPTLKSYYRGKRSELGKLEDADQRNWRHRKQMERYAMLMDWKINIIKMTILH